MAAIGIIAGGLGYLNHESARRAARARDAARGRLPGWPGCHRFNVVKTPGYPFDIPNVPIAWALVGRHRHRKRDDLDRADVCQRRRGAGIATNGVQTEPEPICGAIAPKWGSFSRHQVSYTLPYASARALQCGSLTSANRFNTVPIHQVFAGGACITSWCVSCRIRGSVDQQYGSIPLRRKRRDGFARQLRPGDTSPTAACSPRRWRRPRRRTRMFLT